MHRPVERLPYYASLLASAALLALLVACGDSDPAATACETAEDCPTDQICQNDQCVDQPDDECRPGEQICDGECVQTESDDDHCGGCGVDCDDNEICAKGFCICETGAIECGDRCVDTSSDDDHCGACGNQCGDDAICQMGNCIGDCPDGETLCGGECVDLDENDDHCGRCHDHCGPRQQCDGGECECADDYTECSGECVDTDTDVVHCGECGGMCTDGRVCSDGECVWECPPDQSVCDDGCFDLQTSDDHCGECGETCSTAIDGAVAFCDDGTCVQECSFDGHSRCDQLGLCADLDTDPDHCGECGNTCSTDIDGAVAFCDGTGTCEKSCALSNHTLCEGAEVCTDLQTDDDHCNECDNPCEEGKTCIEGNCQEEIGPEDCDPNDDPFGGGEGTAVDPYRICSADQLIRIDDSEQNLDSYYELRADIDLTTTNFAVIGQGQPDGGDWEEAFSGVLDGSGFELIGLELNPADGDYVGLFGVVTESGEIHDLELVDADITGTESVGALAGHNEGRITAVTASGTVTGERAVGGLVGVNDAGGTIENSRAEGDVSSTSYEAGGLAGVNDHEIFDSVAEVDVQGPDRVGGLVGDGSDSDCRIERSRATGEVSETQAGDGFGGLVGSLGGSVDPCEIIESTATGDVDAPSSDHVGGLIGWGGFSDTPFVVDSYATGDVTGDSATGGFIGAYGPDIADSYAYGESSGGGFVGTDPATIEDSYYNADLNSSDASTETTGLTETEFGDQSNFDDEWDFQEVWEMSTSLERPVLQWEE